MASSTRDPITCHVLDQTTGLPAPAVAVTLTVGSSTSKALTYTALTSTTDGRINTWTRAPESPTLFEALGVHDWMTQEAGRKVVCSLKFNTLQYFGEGKTFFPEVEIRFFVDTAEGRDHWHVPLLLGPWSYTTYRGS